MLHEPSPALLGHCELVYKEMNDRAETQTLDGVEAKVYTGHLTKLFEDLRLSVPYYSTVTRALKEMDCVRQLRRGGGSAPSVWLIIQPPTSEMFHQPETAQAKRAEANEQVMQMIRDLASRVTALEAIHQDELEPVL